MRIGVAAIGRLRGGPEAELIDEYAERIRAMGRAQGVALFEIRDFEPPKGLQGAQRRESESVLLASAAGKGKRVVLDERGDNLTSEALARRIAQWRDGGAPEIAFLIGGADGCAPSLRESADLILAFGKATFPHLLVRVMLVEQIYRALTILSGHPYHRA